MKIRNMILQEDGSVTARMCKVTPEQAVMLLATNTHNRKMSNRVVDKYVDEILKGEWLPTNNGIGFDLDGILIDGQHRLEAIAISKKETWILVVTGLPKLSQEKIDRHNKRSLSDAWELSGYSATRGSVQVATFLAKHGSGSITATVSDSEIKAYFELYEESLLAISKEVHAQTKLFPVGVRGALVMAHSSHGEKVIEFVKAMRSEIPKSVTCPAYRLKRLLFEFKGGGGAQFQTWSYRRACYAINAWIQGRQISAVRKCDEIVSD